MFRSKYTRLREFKLKIRLALQPVDNGMAQIFPYNIAPRDANGPLGERKINQWVKRIEMKARFQALIMSLILTPTGFSMIYENHINIFGWMFFLAGSFSAYFLFMMQHWDKEIQDDRIDKLEQTIKELMKSK